MRKRTLGALFAVVVLVAATVSAWVVPGLWAETQRICSDASETVALLHGLGRSSRSMHALRDGFAEAGYNVININYASTDQPIEAISRAVAGQLEDAACERPAETLHFVTHSMGGIVLRQMLATDALAELPYKLGRAVMISPPNRGSEVVDRLGDWALFGWINGPAGRQLGTTEDSLPNRLGPAAMPVGVITGDRSINLLLSRLIPGQDDGKVAVERAKLEGMQDFLVVHRTHPFIMSARETLEQSLRFIEEGGFADEVVE